MGAVNTTRKRYSIVSFERGFKYLMRSDLPKGYANVCKKRHKSTMKNHRTYDKLQYKKLINN